MVIIGSGNGLVSDRPQAITLTNDNMLSNRSVGANLGVGKAMKIGRSGPGAGIPLC